ncbi:unnamed protein product [Ectocarpus sp. 8 AP-2014]
MAPRLRPCMSTVFSSEKRGCFFFNQGGIERRVPGNSHQSKINGVGTCYLPHATAAVALPGDEEQHCGRRQKLGRFDGGKDKEKYDDTTLLSTVCVPQLRTSHILPVPPRK